MSCDDSENILSSGEQAQILVGISDKSTVETGGVTKETGDFFRKRSFRGIIQRCWLRSTGKFAGFAMRYRYGKH